MAAKQWLRENFCYVDNRRVSVMRASRSKVPKYASMRSHLSRFRFAPKR